ncbi:hypothetical protein BS50DRAFT_626342 [Corynespora cassiicola Philippines]|uniref:Uncharacterized protein n=1 Tax=Corynespora cassiicola Philippines TaxID=1448308 RepID=A0A2T2N3T6_CORCC|nr:hypothetical protein BS50DRAFT_626342 [Corynespora cassiicola Philippines]
MAKKRGCKGGKKHNTKAKNQEDKKPDDGKPDDKGLCDRKPDVTSGTSALANIERDITPLKNDLRKPSCSIDPLFKNLASLEDDLEVLENSSDSSGPEDPPSPKPAPHPKPRNPHDHSLTPLAPDPNNESEQTKRTRNFWFACCKDLYIVPSPSPPSQPLTHPNTMSDPTPNPFTTASTLIIESSKPSFGYDLGTHAIVPIPPAALLSPTTLFKTGTLHPKAATWFSRLAFRNSVADVRRRLRGARGVSNSFVMAHRNQLVLFSDDEMRHRSDVGAMVVEMVGKGGYGDLDLGRCVVGVREIGEVGFVLEEVEELKSVVVAEVVCECGRWGGEQE